MSKLTIKSDLLYDQLQRPRHVQNPQGREANYAYGYRPSDTAIYLGGHSLHLAIFHTPSRADNCRNSGHEPGLPPPHLFLMALRLNGSFLYARLASSLGLTPLGKQRPILSIRACSYGAMTHSNPGSRHLGCASPSPQVWVALANVEHERVYHCCVDVHDLRTSEAAESQWAFRVYIRASSAALGTVWPF